MASKTPIIRTVQRLTEGVAPWTTVDPFLFCVHHRDIYPQGNDQMAPDPRLLRGREIGHDFEGKDGWRMYHGETIPGFPRHPHRGFETITIVTEGYIDHSDSLGASGRIGPGDVQWMTAGSGIEHCEMFPLINSTAPNPTDFFQLWLNLPKASKMVKPHFTMFWNEQVPTVVFENAATKAKGYVRVVAGKYNNAVAVPNPPPESFAADPSSNIEILIITIESGASVPLYPMAATTPSSLPTTRVLYYFDGPAVEVCGQTIDRYAAVSLDPTQECSVTSRGTGGVPSRCLMLQGRNIGEPVAQHGPFVMNTQQEIRQAFEDYRRTNFGRWPHDSDGVVLPRDVGRVAKMPDGTVERPPQEAASSKREEL